jgi:hypothetical protein
VVFPTSPEVCFIAYLFLCILCPYFLDGGHTSELASMPSLTFGELLWNCGWPIFPVCDLGFFSNAPVVGKLWNGEIGIHLCTRFYFLVSGALSRQRPFPDDAFSCFRRAVDGKLCYVPPLPIAMIFSDKFTFFCQLPFFSSGPSVHTLVQREGGECFIISSWAGAVVSFPAIGWACTRACHHASMGGFSHAIDFDFRREMHAASRGRPA